MKIKFYLSSFIFVFLLIQISQAQKISKKALPAWIAKIPPSLSSTVKRNQVSEGYLFTLIDRQVNIGLQTQYSHFSKKIFTHAGVQNGSEIQVSFDPKYQKLIFHEINVWRNGKSIDKLNLSKFTILQKEEDQERFLYDGSLTALLVLEDIREGDVIDYSFSIIGFNPIYKNKFSNTYSLQYNDPMDHLYLKIIAPINRHLNYKIENGTQKLNTFIKNGENHYELELKQVKGLTSEDHTPSWFDPYCSIAFSEYSSWEEFSDWVNELFVFQNISKEMEEKANEIVKGSTTAEEKALKIIRFVQDNIRYTGFEGGISGYKPHHPLKVYGQRFGDCKDKSLLLAQLLRAINVEAYPVLVNTSYENLIKNWLPLSTIFDHCIVKIIFNNKTIWIDPTISQQRGNMFNTNCPDYKLGFVIKGKGSGFEEIHPFNVSGTEIKELFEISDYEEGCEYYIETKYLGENADAERSYFYNNSILDIQNTYLNFYSSNYSEIDTLALVTIEDDTINNIFKTFEKYSIGKLWGKSESDSSRLQASFFPQCLYDKFRVPRDKKRFSPMYLPFPVEFTQTTEIHLPELWDASNSKRVIKNSNFIFTERIKYRNQTCFLNYHYKTKKDVVEVNEFKGYLRDINAINASLTYQLTYKPPADELPPSNSSAALMIVFYIIVSAIAIFLCYRVYYYNPLPKVDEYYSPIGGWLILLAIGLAIAPIRIMVDMREGSFFDSNSWQNMLGNTLTGSMFIIEAVYNVFLFFTHLILAYLFFTRRSSFPRIFTWAMPAKIVFLVFDNFMVYYILGRQGSLSDIILNLVVLVVFGAVWIYYLNFSERAKTTFNETI